MAKFLINWEAEKLLPIFVREAASRPFLFGEWDCVITLANWLHVCTGIDPAEDIRGTYKSVIGWKRIVKSEGGMIDFIHNRAARVGFEIRVGPPQIGDIGLLELKPDPSRGDWVGAIRGKGMWWYKIGPGITGVEMPVQRIWGLGCQRQSALP